MQYRSLLALAALMSAPLALSNGKPLVTKHNGSGYTPPEYSRYEKCEVFLDKVVITKRFGYPMQLGFTKSETRPITLDPSIENVLTTASQEELLKQDNYLCDAPSTQIEFSGKLESLILFTSGGCGSPRLDRQGPASLMLKELVDQYCPVTNDYGRR